MGFAEKVDCPVVIVADIDRGGVFAHLVGTLQLLAESEQKRVLGFVINKFRGDLGLLQPGIDWLQAYTGKPVLGVLPYLQGLHLDAEDAICTSQLEADHSRPLRVIVPVFPRISNHTDLDALRLHPDVDLQFVGPGKSPPGADLIILPGSKNVRADLQWLQDHGWQDAIVRHLRYGGKLIGICGGYQMLGTRIEDPHGIEDLPGSCAGLCLLDITTQMQSVKQLRHVHGALNFASARVEGYEIHCGVTSGADAYQPALELSDGRNDGVLSNDGQILGTYLHGLFDYPQARDALLSWAGAQPRHHPGQVELREQQLDRLADTLESQLDCAALFPGALC